MEEQSTERPDWLAWVAVAAAVFGLAAWFIPVIGCPLAITGIITGALGLRSEQRLMSGVALTLCAISLMMSLANAALGAYIAGLI